MADPVQAVLEPLSIPATVKADAWDAVHGATDQKDLEQRLRRLPGLTDAQRADLWDSRFKGGGAPAPAQAKPEQQGFFSSAFEQIKAPAEFAYNLVTNLPETAKGAFLQPGIRANQAIEAAKRGEYQEAAGRALQAIPVLGYAAEAGEKMAGQLREGNVPGAAGTFAGLVATPKIYSAAGSGVKAVAEPAVQAVRDLPPQITGAGIGAAVGHRVAGFEGATIGALVGERVGAKIAERRAAAPPRLTPAEKLRQAVEGPPTPPEDPLAAMNRRIDEFKAAAAAQDAAAPPPVVGPTIEQAAAPPSPAPAAIAPAPPVVSSPPVAPPVEPFQPATLQQKLEGLSPAVQAAILARRQRGIPPPQEAAQMTPQAFAAAIREEQAAAAAAPQPPEPQPTPAEPVAPAPAEAAPAPGSVEDLSRQFNAAVGTQEPPAPQPAKETTARGEARIQANREAAAQRWVDRFSEGNFGRDYVDQMSLADWVKLAKQFGEAKPPSDETMALIKSKMAASPESPAPQPETAAPPPAAAETPAARAGKAEKPFEPSLKTTQTETSRAYQAGEQFGDILRNAGVTAIQARAMGPADWVSHAKAAGLPTPSPLAMEYAIKKLQRFDRLDALAERVSSGSEPGTAEPPAEPGAPGPGNEGPGTAVQEPIRTNAAAPTIGQDTRVRIPGEAQSYNARYEVRELADLKPSHSGATFQPTEGYAFRNDRDYNNPVNREKVVRWATPAEFDPAYHISDNADAVNGPTVIDSSGHALGGNGRLMILQRVNAMNPVGAAQYRNLLRQRAGYFGIDPAAVAKMREPVLVRVIDDAEFGAGGKSKQSAITDFNKVGTASLTPSEAAIANSRRVSADTLDNIAARLEAKGPEATLAQVLEGAAGPQVLQRLIDDGVIEPQKRAGYLQGGELSADGKQLVSRLLLGRFFRDAKQLDTIAPVIRNKLERIAAPLARVESKSGWSLAEPIQDALELAQEATAHGAKNLNDYLNQTSLFGGQKYSPQAVVLAEQLRNATPTALTKAVRQYAQDAEYGSGGQVLFGEPPTPTEAFAEAFGTKGSRRALR